MTQTVITLLFAVGAVALLVVGYSITYFFRGRHIQSDVGDNENMKKMGLKCTSQQIREDEAVLKGISPADVPIGCPGADCATCNTHNVCEPNNQKESN